MAVRYTRVPRATLWLVEGGAFTMGGDDPDAQPAFRCEVESFYISKTTITVEQFRAYEPGYRSSSPTPADDEPAVRVTFGDALGYCAWYSRLSNKHFRLPTEAEWEFACRGGKSTRYFFGDDPASGDPYVWHRGNCGGRCHPVESRRANPLGLHEVLGNVWEWTASLYRPYPVQRGDGRDDPDAPGARVLRGGSFLSALADIGCDVRRAYAPDARLDDVGFRIVRSL